MKAVMLAVAFLFWAVNQLWPDLRQATFFNDIAIALFVLDVFLVMVGWPATSPDESFAETYTPDDAPVE
jgi:Flp pilus assembly protein protease CpaA